MAIPKRILFDLSVVAILHYVGLSLDIYSRPVRRGFHCGDATIGYEKQDNTITPLVVLTGSIFIPMATMLLIDVISGRHRGWDIYHNLMVFEIGGLLTYVSNNILKYNLGLPRPYFLTACQPDYSQLDCKPGQYVIDPKCTGDENEIKWAGYNLGLPRPYFLTACQSDYSQLDCKPGQYVIDPKCTGDENEIKWAGLTFPSLHSSVTGYGLTYFMVFLYRYNAHKDSGYFTSVFTAATYVVCLTWAVFVGVSRVLDRRHHPIDVVAGALWGITIATITILTVKRSIQTSTDPVSKGDNATGNRDVKPFDKQL